jgi:hypothetical protein
VATASPLLRRVTNPGVRAGRGVDEGRESGTVVAGTGPHEPSFHRNPDPKEPDVGSRERREKERLAEMQRACGTQAEELRLLALRTTDPALRAGAIAAAEVSNRQAGQTLAESVADPRNKPTAAMRAARKALRDGA